GHAVIQFCRAQHHVTLEPFRRAECWAHSKEARVDLFFLTLKSLGHSCRGRINVMSIFLFIFMLAQNEENKVRLRTLAHWEGG
ncbi:mCG144773, partial [Mus musculus]